MFTVYWSPCRGPREPDHRSGSGHGRVVCESTVERDRTCRRSDFHVLPISTYPGVWRTAAHPGSQPCRHSPAPPARAETLSASFRKAAEKMLPSVVAVRPVGLVGRGIPYGILRRPVFPGEPGGMPGHPGEPDRLPGGSGVVVEAARGLILTSDQTIARASGWSWFMRTDGKWKPIA